MHFGFSDFALLAKKYGSFFSHFFSIKGCISVGECTKQLEVVADDEQHTFMMEVFQGK